MWKTCTNPAGRKQMERAALRGQIDLIVAAVQLAERRLSVGELRGLLACELLDLKEAIDAGICAGRLAYAGGFCSLVERSGEHG